MTEITEMRETTMKTDDAFPRAAPAATDGAPRTAALSADGARRLTAGIKAIRARVTARTGAEDLRHIKRLSLLGRVFSAVGYALSALGPNPISMVLIGLGRFARWVVVAHPVLHKAYDGLAGGDPAWNSRTFARGRRSLWDWFDWLDADAWQAQHNVSHHCYTGDERDPDRVAVNMAWLKSKPKVVRALALLLTACTWKWIYYGPATRSALRRRHERAAEAAPEGRERATWSPSVLLDREMLLRSYLPYALVHFVLLPLAFLPFGRGAAIGVLVNSLVAELLSNLHSFAVIAPTHTGLDIPIFEGAARSREEYYVRQIVGSVNYESPGSAADFMHGYMGYQIEHHLWPDLPLRRYPEVAREVEALCREVGLPYRRDSVWRRIAEMVRAVISDEEVQAARVAIAPASARRAGAGRRSGGDLELASVHG
ncbi:fatty acid desaturase family protein [Sorangium sp. So ce1000]|uniref:fatty acid desaturase family protein n=1 Tax=Sorangium sp. So ce1000 TaxID=3133325 RepID=UPI003F639DAC